MITRRGFLGVILALGVAPAIARFPVMRVRSLVLPGDDDWPGPPIDMEVDYAVGPDDCFLVRSIIAASGSNRLQEVRLFSKEFEVFNMRVLPNTMTSVYALCLNGEGLRLKVPKGTTVQVAYTGRDGNNKQRIYRGS